MCHFKIEISDKHNIVSQQLIIEADLLYSDISGLGGWDGLEFHLDQVAV